MLAELTKTAGNDRMNWMGTNLLNEVFCTMKDMYYTMNIAGLDRDLPLCPISDKLMIGAFVIFGDMELTTACAKALLERIPEHDVMITAESKGIPLICEMARLSGNERYVLARKAAKLYMKNVLKVEVNSITTANRQTLCLDGKDAEYLKGKRVVIVDDVISTGESLHALETLVNEAGGQIVGRMAILAEGDATRRDDLVYLEKLPLFNSEGQPIDLHNGMKALAVCGGFPSPSYPPIAKPAGRCYNGDHNSTMKRGDARVHEAERDRDALFGRRALGGPA